MADPSPMERAFNEITAGDIEIAEMKKTIARLTAPVTEEEMRRLDNDWAESKDDTIEAYRAALTAFLERRMKG